jgi:hypothetical protein
MYLFHVADGPASPDPDRDHRGLAFRCRSVQVQVCRSFCCLLACACFGPGNITPKNLTDRERAVKVHHQGTKPNCDYDELGTVEAVSGTSTEMGTYESSVAKLQRAAAAKGATAVIVLDHGKTGVADSATGMATRCK